MTTPNRLPDGLDAETRDNIAGALWMPELQPDQITPDVLAKMTSQKNSNRAFGERFQYRLRYMLDNPDSFTPSFKRRYELLLQYSDSLSPHQAYAMSVLLGSDSSKGYKQLPDVTPPGFPTTNAEDLEMQVGWYFFVGSCTGANGKEYGVELMIWRYALLPLPVARHFGLSNIENQIVELQFAISEAGGRHYQAVPIVIAGTTGLLEYGADSIYARMGKNVIKPLVEGSLFPICVQAQGTYKGSDGPVEIAIDLTLTSGKGYLLQGKDGCSPCCGGVGTLYYSMPNLVMDGSKSSLRFNGEEVTLREGRFWFDHQWATGMIPGGSPRSHVLRAAATMQKPGPGGWDWFMAQFDGDRQLTVSSLHANEFREFYFQTGPTPPGTMTVPITGKYMDEHAQQHDVSGTLAITEWLKSEDTPDPAQYPPTDTWYPNRWEFSFDTGLPEEIRRFTMTPIVAGGQSGYFAFGGHYSEGAVYLRDPQGRDIGRGFAESVLYADVKKMLVALAGLPDSEEVHAALEHETPTLLEKAQSIAYIIWPPNKKELGRLMASCLANGLDAPHPKQGAKRV